MSSDLIYLGKDVMSFYTAERYQGYDKVILNLDESNYVSSPCVLVTNASKWDERDVGEYQFVWIASNNRWRTPFGTNANTAALVQNYGITPHFPNVTSAKDGDVITVYKKSVNDEVTITADITRSGATLEADCPLVKPSERQAVADNVLKKVYGFEYQPYTASGAYMTPAAEIGDAITSYGIYAGLFEQETTFNRLFLSNIGSALHEEAEVEMQYDGSVDRRYTRRLAETTAEFAILADEISSKVSNDRFNAELTVLAQEIGAKVSSTGGLQNTFAWSLTPTGFILYANGTQVFKCDRSGITVTGDGTFTGNVYAKNIQYGGSYGTLSGSGITNASLNGDAKIVPYSVTGGYGGNIAAASIIPANTSFTGTLDQVGRNAANIDALYSQVARISAGYFDNISVSNSIAFQNWYFYVDGSYVRASPLG